MKGGAWVPMQDLTGHVVLPGHKKVWKRDIPHAVLASPVGNTAAVMVRQGNL